MKFLPPAAEDDWSRTLPPEPRIGSPSVLVRAELWRLARAAWGPSYTGDWAFVAEAWRRAASRRWIPLVLGRVQRISKGSPTDVV